MIKSKKKKCEKKGVSPVVATVLLISMVIAISLILFLWLRGFIQEAVIKFDENIELACQDVSLDFTYLSGGNRFYVLNNGNIPVYSLRIKIIRSGGHTTVDLHDQESHQITWPPAGLRAANGFEVNIGILLGTTTPAPSKIVAIPILIGTSSSGEEKTHVCAERHGYVIYED
ncbi:hypothetical protein K0A97_03390 [Patescibacteria group bacterium]|nr:hypothetical protein [Patescibacteria group bacterium]